MFKAGPCFLAVCAVLFGGAARGAVPEDATARKALVGQPASLSVQPATLHLSGPRDMRQLVVTGKYADGSVRDLTPFCEITPDKAGILHLHDGGFIRPAKNGSTTLLVRAGGLTTKAPVTVKDFDRPAPVSFRHHV